MAQLFQDKYYPASYSERHGLSCWDGGEFGGKSVRMMVKYISPKKAAPVYSNRTKGIAVDFFMVEAGNLLQADTGKRMKKANARLEKSWFYRWLETHKVEYGIERIPSEAWHWEFQK
jgi:hypothetical protein